MRVSGTFFYSRLGCHKALFSSIVKVIVFSLCFSTNLFISVNLYEHFILLFLMAWKNTESLRCKTSNLWSWLKCNKKKTKQKNEQKINIFLWSSALRVVLSSLGCFSMADVKNNSLVYCSDQIKKCEVKGGLWHDTAFQLHHFYILVWIHWHLIAYDRPMLKEITLRWIGLTSDWSALTIQSSQELCLSS